MISFLEQALSGDSLWFFHEDIAPHDGRFGRDRDDALHRSAPSLAQNAQSLSTFIQLLQETLCTVSARSTLQTTLKGTKLRFIQEVSTRLSKCDKGEALKILER